MITNLPPPGVRLSIDLAEISGTIQDSNVVSYGIAVYYKFYTGINPDQTFNNDVIAFQQRSAENQPAVAGSLGFYPVSVDGRDTLNATKLPTFAINTDNSSWVIYFMAPTTNKEDARIGYSQSDKNQNTILRRGFFRNANDQAPGFPYIDSTSYRTGDPDAAASAAAGAVTFRVGFVAFMYQFSFSYGSLIYSSAVSLGSYQIK